MLLLDLSMVVNKSIFIAFINFFIYEVVIVG